MKTKDFSQRFGIGLRARAGRVPARSNRSTPTVSAATTETIEPRLKPTEPARTAFLRLQLPDSTRNNRQEHADRKTRKGHCVSCLKIPIITGRTAAIGTKKAEYDSLRWFVFDDRKMYKPKEEVAVKGYIRKITGGKLGDVEGLGDAANGLTYSVKDPRNNEIAKGTAQSECVRCVRFQIHAARQRKSWLCAYRSDDKHQHFRRQLFASVSDTGISTSRI